MASAAVERRKAKRAPYGALPRPIARTTDGSRLSALRLPRFFARRGIENSDAPASRERSRSPATPSALCGESYRPGAVHPSHAVNRAGEEMKRSERSVEGNRLTAP